MSKNIAISDEVSRRLKREKGDRSFSELIARRLEEGGRLADVTGQRILDRETAEEVRSTLGDVSECTMERLDDEAP
ncbi:MAG: antitoxin VapB family protein [Haloarculaceae archaeon]